MTDLYLPAEQRREIIRGYQRKWQLDYFIESGTADGATPCALRNDFQMLYTIEIDEGLYRHALAKFAVCPNVHVWWGDSAEVLPKIMEEIHSPALCWLDGHWSCAGPNPNGPDTPIREELELLFADGRPHVILIDDARVFREGLDWERERYDYPTLTWVREIAEAHGYSYELADDIIRLEPPK